MFQLAFPQPGMLPREDYARLADLVGKDAHAPAIDSLVQEIRGHLNPRPGGQRQDNVPRLDGEWLPGLHHKGERPLLSGPGQDLPLRLQLLRPLGPVRRRPRPALRGQGRGAAAALRGARGEREARGPHGPLQSLAGAGDPQARAAIPRILDTGVVIRGQAPVLRHINDDPRVWARLWRTQVRLGSSLTTCSWSATRGHGAISSCPCRRPPASNGRPSVTSRDWRGPPGGR